MPRRTNIQLSQAETFCTSYLIANRNDPHAAYNDSIKEHLLSGKSLPYYVIGIKDFIKTADSLNSTLFKPKNEDLSLSDEKKDIVEKLSGITEEEYIKIWEESKQLNLSNDEKTILAGLWGRIKDNDFKNVLWSEITVYQTIEIV